MFPEPLSSIKLLFEPLPLPLFAFPKSPASLDGSINWLPKPRLPFIKSLLSRLILPPPFGLRASITLPLASNIKSVPPSRFPVMFELAIIGLKLFAPRLPLICTSYISFSNTILSPSRFPDKT